MRVNVRCPLTCQPLCSFFINLGRAPKAALAVLLVILTVIPTLIMLESRLSSNRRHHRDVIEDDKRSKYTVAVATDTSNSLLRYGIVIDCGSSGSRVFVYFWPPHSGNPQDLLSVQQMKNQNAEDVIMKIEPGISAYAVSPTEASEYLKPLLLYAADHVPKEKHKETPLYIMATAGMRLLPQSQQDAILDDLKVDIPREFDFLFDTESHFEVITGKQEGVYAWISINYILGRFDHVIGDDPLTVVEVAGTDQTHVRKRTVGVMDMGGASAQIAFEVQKSVRFISPQENIAKGLLAEFNLGCSRTDHDHIYRLYVTTFLGFGGNAARKRYEGLLISEHIKSQGQNSSHSLPNSMNRVIKDPCLPLGLEDTTSHMDITGTQVVFTGTGDLDKCKELVKPLLNQSAECMKEPCSMNGVYQPSVDSRNNEFYGFSEYWYTMEDVLRVGGKYDYMKFHKAANEYCSTEWSTLLKWYEQNLYPKADMNRFRYQCFKSAWMTVMLHDGFGFSKINPQVTSVSLLNGREVHWTLGALLYKTRFYPLSDIQKHESHRYRHPFAELSQTTYAFLICIFIVMAAIFVYLRRLRIVPRPDLRKVPSMAYFMTEPDQVEEGITVRSILDFQ